MNQGQQGLSTDKSLILYHKYEIDTIYLITGECMKDFGVDYHIANCYKEQRDIILDGILADMSRLAFWERVYHFSNGAGII